MKPSTSAFKWGLVVAGVAALPWVVSQVVSLVSILQEGGLELLGLPIGILIFLVTCVPLFVLMGGIRKRSTLAVALSVVVFPYAWLGGLEDWSSRLMGTVHQVEMVVSIAVALFVAGFFVRLAVIANRMRPRKPTIKTN